MNNYAFEQLERNPCLVRLKLTNRKPVRLQTARCRRDQKNTDEINISEHRPQLRIYASCLHIPGWASQNQIPDAIQRADELMLFQNVREEVIDFRQRC